MGYNTPIDYDTGWIRAEIDRIWRVVNELAAPTSGQIHDQLAKLTTLVNDLATAIENVSASGATWKGPVDTTGTVKADGGMNSVDVYNRLVTGSGSFRTVSANVLGQLGQTVSSQRYKQDIETAAIPRETLRQLRVVFFRYLAAPPFSAEDQPLLLGLIAEEVHELGLTWLVVYNDDGEPEALVDFALPYLGLLLAQYDAEDVESLQQENVVLRSDLAALSARVAALEDA